MWIEGAHDRRVKSDDAMPVKNGRAQQIKAKRDAFLYSFGGYDACRYTANSIGTKVRIFDSRGFNIFDRSLRTEAKPKGHAHTASYPVQGFYKSGQRYEKHEIMAVKVYQLA